MVFQVNLNYHCAMFAEILTNLHSILRFPSITYFSKKWYLFPPPITCLLVSFVLFLINIRLYSYEPNTPIKYFNHEPFHIVIGNYRISKCPATLQVVSILKYAWIRLVNGQILVTFPEFRLKVTVDWFKWFHHINLRTFYFFINHRILIIFIHFYLFTFLKNKIISSNQKVEHFK